MSSELLNKICLTHPDRRVGGPGNDAANTLFAEYVSAYGFRITAYPFDCMDWSGDSASIQINGTTFAARPSPCAPGCEARGTLEQASTVEELERIQGRGSVLLLHGDLVKEQLMPRNFVFYNPEEHRRILSLLEQKQPAVIIAATGRNPQLAGSLYPFPLIEDGDFHIPSVYLKDLDGEQLLSQLGRPAMVRSDAVRHPATARQIVATRRGTTDQRVVITAHIDTKPGTPGALDNGTGVVTLMQIARELAERQVKPSVELIPFNGEDNYAVPGQMLWLNENSGRMDNILLAINIDGAGCAGHPTAVSLYGCDEHRGAVIRRELARTPDFIEGEPWYQGDHSMFVMNGRPAVAITSANAMELCASIIHTAADRPEHADPEKLSLIARFVLQAIPTL